jgi:hypothetical protein
VSPGEPVSSSERAEHRVLAAPPVKRRRSLKVRYLLLWFAGLALVLVYARRGARVSGFPAAVLVLYTVATFIGLKAPRLLQWALLLLVALLPLAAEGALMASQTLGRPEGLEALSRALVIGTFVVGAPAWVALVVTLLIRGIEQPKPQRVSIVVGLSLLVLCWGTALVLFLTVVGRNVAFLG